MKRKLPIVLCLGFLVGLVPAQVDTVWFRHHQYSPSYPYQFMKHAKTLLVDAEGASYVCAYGQFKSSSYDYIVLKYDEDGKLLWEASYDAGATEGASAIAVDEQGAVYVTGQSSVTSSNGYMLTVKLYPDGRPAWARKVNGSGSSSYNVGYAIAACAGAVYVAGQLTSGSSGPDMALLKFDAGTGEEKWRRTITRSGNSNHYEAAYDVRVSEAGAIFIGGRTYSGGRSRYDATFARYDADGNQSWQRDVNIASSTNELIARICLVGGLVVGTGYTSGTGQDALTVACQQSDGGLKWSKSFGGPGGGADLGNDIVGDPSGDILVCGLGSGSTSPDALLLKYRSDGALLWTRLYDSGLGSDEAMALDVDQWGGVVAGCQVTPQSMTEAPLVVVKYTSDGNLGWEFYLKPQTLGGTNTALDVACVKDQTIAAGITTWPYPNHTDPSVMKLVEVPDVGVERLITPHSPPNPGEDVTPSAAVRNYSTLPASLTCQLDITDGYSEELPVSLAPGEVKTLVFPGWTPSTHGNWLWQCCTELGLDYDRTNDTARQVVYVNGPATDAGVTALIEPHGNMPVQTSVGPTARFRNLGTGAVDAWAFMLIGLGSTSLYRDSVSLPGFEPDGCDTTVQFRGWVASQPGFVTARCSTWAEGDECALNDTTSFRFVVINEPIGAWTCLDDVPLGTSNQAVYKGGGLATDGAVLYVLKGYKTREVHLYELGTANWTNVESVPAGPVDKGGAILADDLGRLYVVKGNKTFEFWRFDPVVGWTALADIPEGPKGKTPKGGTGLAYAVVKDTGYVYLLKGSGKAEFYRYDIVRDTWDSMPDAPAGASGKAKYADGSALAYDGTGTVYCLKGKYNEVFAFDVATNQWLPGQLPSVPLAGADQRRRKVKHGGDISWAHGRLAVLKGGNTCQFWVLEPTDSSWYEYPPVPQAVERAKRVKAGGGLEFTGSSFYVLKGNKTRELWRFDPSTLYAGRNTQYAGTGVMSGAERGAYGVMSISPIPVSGFGFVRFGGPLTEAAILTLFDASGRVCWKTVVPPGRSSVALDLRSLAAGVYFLSAEEGRGRLGCKVIVAR